MAFPLLLYQLSLQLFHANTLVAKRSSKIFWCKKSSIKSNDKIQWLVHWKYWHYFISLIWIYKLWLNLYKCIVIRIDTFSITISFYYNMQWYRMKEVKLVPVFLIYNLYRRSVSQRFQRNCHANERLVFVLDWLKHHKLWIV